MQGSRDIRQRKPRGSEQHPRILKSFSHKGKPGRKKPGRQLHGQVYCNCGQHAPVRADPQLFPPYLVVQAGLRLTGPASTAITAKLGEHEATMLLPGGVLETGTVPDTHERHVLLEQLKVPGLSRIRQYRRNADKSTKTRRHAGFELIN